MEWGRGSYTSEQILAGHPPKSRRRYERVSSW